MVVVVVLLVVVDTEDVPGFGSLSIAVLWSLNLQQSCLPSLCQMNYLHALHYSVALAAHIQNLSPDYPKEAFFSQVVLLAKMNDSQEMAPIPPESQSLQ